MENINLPQLAPIQQEVFYFAANDSEIIKNLQEFYKVHINSVKADYFPLAKGLVDMTAIVTTAINRMRVAEKCKLDLNISQKRDIAKVFIHNYIDGAKSGEFDYLIKSSDKENKEKGGKFAAIKEEVVTVIFQNGSDDELRGYGVPENYINGRASHESEIRQIISKHMNDADVYELAYDLGMVEYKKGGQIK